MAEASTEKRTNRKRKKTFLRNARKYAKRGYYGRGSKLTEDTYQYFVRIMETYKEGFPNDEEKLVFVNNVFEQTTDEEINISCNQVGCRVIDTLLPFANDDVLERYMTKLGDELRPMCSDRFASHVIEALLKESFTRSLKNDEDSRSKYTDFTIKVSRFLLNNMEDYMWDTYGNQTMRSVLHYFAAIPKTDDKKQTLEEIEIPDNYKDIVNDYGKRLITWPQFKELPLSDLTSGYLQVLLKALSKMNKKLLKEYVKKLLEECFAPAPETNVDDLPAVFMSKSNMMLLETALQIVKPKLFTVLYTRCFAGRILKLSTARSTNFAVQKLFNSCQEKAEFDLMFDEVDDHFKEILESGHSGVLLAIAQACKRLASKQGGFIQNLMKALDCFEPAERQSSIVLCACKLLSYDALQKDKINWEKEKLNLQGTLILQAILTFNKPIKIVNSILEMDPNDVKGIFCNSMGSHVADSFLTSNFVGEKSREKLVRRMQGQYQNLASSKFGSRSFDALWNVASVKMKLYIMDEMLHKEALWSNTEFGKIIAYKVNTQLYRKSKEEWKSTMGKTGKTKNLAEEVLGS